VRQQAYKNKKKGDEGGLHQLPSSPNASLYNTDENEGHFPLSGALGGTNAKLATEESKKDTKKKKGTLSKKTVPKVNHYDVVKLGRDLQYRLKSLHIALKDCEEVRRRKK
jgi:hypothetical protein